MAATHIKETLLDLNFYRDWAAKREEEAEKEKKPSYFVTISREFGCEGYDLSLKLIEKLNAESQTQWSLLTRTMIDNLLSEDDFLPEMVQSVSEKRWTFKDWFIDALVPDYLQSQSTKVFKGMRNIILNAINNGNCVILGAGSQIVSQNLDPKKFSGTHIRLTGSYDWRLARTQQLFGLQRDEVDSSLKAKQGLRDKFIADFTGRDAADPSLYHILFNNAKNNPDHMAALITEDLRLRGAFD